jgi:hypothetical protein
MVIALQGDGASPGGLRLAGVGHARDVDLEAEIRTRLPGQEHEDTSTTPRCKYYCKRHAKPRCTCIYVHVQAMHARAVYVCREHEQGDVQIFINNFNNSR